MIELILVIIAIVIFIGLQVFIDVKDIKHINSLRKELLTIAKKKSQQNIVVVIDINRSAKDVELLLDHLSSFGYKKIEIIILFKKYASKKTKNALVDCKKNYALNFSRIEIVESKRGLSVVDVVRNNSKGQLVLKLNTSNRLSKNFFELISIETLLRQQDEVIIPSSHYALEKSIASALQVQQSIVNQIKNRVFKSTKDLSLIDTGIVYKRKFLLSKVPKTRSQKISAISHIYITNQVGENKFLQYISQMVEKTSKNSLSIVLCLLGIVIVLLAVIFMPSKSVIFAIFIASVYFFSSLAIQMRTNGYSLIDRINLFMLVPVYFVFKIFVSLAGLIKLTYKTGNKLFNNRSK